MGNGTSDDIEISDFSRLPTAPVVSVQMLTYQHAPFLAEAIDGVLAQRTDFPIELLVADDASSDGTGDIAKSYQRAHPEIVRVVTGPTNIGVRANRRRVARRIRGEFVAFLRRRRLLDRSVKASASGRLPARIPKQVRFIQISIIS
ncbi:MAG: glycosyltransferase [Xanthomonadales bacterium]|nr:glycosyltransferase [Xanthomonadales bacterium]